MARGAPRVSHILFAVDCFLFFCATHGEAECVRDVLQCYGRASGRGDNFEKSLLSFSINVDDRGREGGGGRGIGGVVRKWGWQVFGFAIVSKEK